MNGQKGKAGAGCDAPGMWQEGKLDALERYCTRDVEALAALALRDEVRVPGGSTREATVWHVLREQRDGDGTGSSGALRSDGTDAGLQEGAAATPGTAARRPRDEQRSESAPDDYPTWEELLQESEQRSGDIADTAPPRLGFQRAVYAEV